jgi:hypothetical protein
MWTKIYQRHHKLFCGLQECTLLDMRIPSLSCPHPLPVSFHTLNPFPWQIKTTAVQASFKETPGGNFIWFCILNVVSGPGECSTTVVTRRDVHQVIYKLVLFSCVWLWGAVDVVPVLGGFCFVLSGVTTYCYSLYYYTPL